MSAQITHTALVVPKSVSVSVKPKPTKAEIIEALAIRKYDQLVKNAADSEERYKEASKKASAMVESHARQHVATLPVNHINEGWLNNNKLTGVAVTFALDNLPREVLSALLLARKLKDARVHVGSVTIASIKSQLRTAMAGQTTGNRVHAMLADPAVVKSLDKMLNKLDETAA